MEEEEEEEEEMATHSVFLAGKLHGQRNLASYSPWGHRESDMTEWLITHMIDREPTGIT